MSPSCCRYTSLRIVIVLLLAACAQLEPQRPPEVRTTFVEIKVPTPTPCFNPADVPKIPTPTPVDTATATTDQLAAAAAADLMALDAYARIVDALFVQCQKSTQEVK